jgi:zinc protease
LTTVLSGQSGRLFVDLRDKKSLAYSVSCSSLEGLDPGHIVVHIGTSPDKVKVALAGIDEHLDRIRQERISDDELVRAVRYLVGTHAIDLQRAGARAMVMALGERLGLGYDHYASYLDHIRSVTAADVMRVAQTYLAPERLVEVVVGPAEQASAEG